MICISRRSLRISCRRQVMIDRPCSEHRPLSARSDEGGGARGSTCHSRIRRRSRRSRPAPPSSNTIDRPDDGRRRQQALAAEMLHQSLLSRIVASDGSWNHVAMRVRGAHTSSARGGRRDLHKGGGSLVHGCRRMGNGARNGIPRGIISADGTVPGMVVRRPLPPAEGRHEPIRPMGKDVADRRRVVHGPAFHDLARHTSPRPRRRLRRPRRGRA